MTAEEIAQAAITKYQAELDKRDRENGTHLQRSMLNGAASVNGNDPKTAQRILARSIFATVVAERSGKSMQAVLEGWNKTKKDAINEYIIEKTINVDTTSQGAGVITTDIAPGIIEYLQAKTVVRGTPGIDLRTMPTGRLEIRKQTSTGTAAWVGSVGSISASQPNVGSITLFAKKLAMFVPISNDWLKRVDSNIEASIMKALSTTMAATEDLAFLRGNGTNYAPTGLRYSINSSNVLTMTATPDAAKIAADLSRLRYAVENSNVNVQNPVYYFPYREFHYLRSLRNSIGLLTFPDIAEKQQYMGVPIRVTSQIPTNLGGGTETEIYFAEASEMIIADTGNLTVDLIANASYLDSTGAQVNGAQTDESVVRIINETDFALAHDQAASVLTGVTWGA